MQLVIVSGNLTRDPEMRYTASGKAVTKFSIAVNEGSGDHKTTEYFDCEAWEKTAELVAEYCSRGKKVLVTGRQRTESWDDKQTGKKMSKKIVVASRVEFMSPAGSFTPTTEPEPDLSDLSF